MTTRLETHPVPDGRFGAVIDATQNQGAFYDAVRQDTSLLETALHASHGLLVIKGLTDIPQHPHLLIELSAMLGDEVENYTHTPTPRHMIHAAQPEILVISNVLPYDRQPPKPPTPATTADGKCPVQFPHRTGWHTDQSFRRPPPDFSLFYGVTVTPHGQGQTLFANGTLAYADLPEATKTQIATLNGLHAILGTGRSEAAVRQGLPVKALQPHQRSRAQSWCAFILSPNNQHSTCVSMDRWIGWMAQYSGSKRVLTGTVQD